MIERADALSHEGWALLYKLCSSKKLLRQPEVHCIIVITLDPPPLDAGVAYTGAAALEASNRRFGGSSKPQKWSDLDWIAYNQVPWFDTPPKAAETGDHIDGGAAGAMVPVIPGVSGEPTTDQDQGRPPPPLPTTASATSRAKRTRSAAAVGADR